MSEPAASGGAAVAPTSNVLRAAAWMGGTVASFAIMAVAVRELSVTLHTFEIVFLRSIVALVIIVALIPRVGLGTLRTRRIGTHFTRNVLHFGGQAAWVFAVSALPLATVFAIEFTVPVWSAVLAVLFLRERMTAGRSVAFALGIVGVLVILRPGFAFIDSAVLIMLGGAVLFSTTSVTTKSLAPTDTPFAILAYMTAMQLPIGLVAAIPVWVMPELAQLPWIVLVGIAAFTAHWCMAHALRHADAVVILPLDFLRMPVIAAVGFLVYAEPLNAFIFAGAAVIFAGTYANIYLEHRRTRRTEA